MKRHSFGAQNRLVKVAKIDGNSPVRPTTISRVLDGLTSQPVAEITPSKPRDYLLFFGCFQLPSFDASPSRRRPDFRGGKFRREKSAARFFGR
jgi:hypothetical protein